MMTLNECQRAAAEAPPGPVLTVAGPGTGKTATLVARAAHLVKSGVSPERVLAFTFTNEAAREMRERLENQGLPAVAATTIHSWCYRLLRRAGERFRVLDEDAAEALFAEAAKEAGVPARERSRAYASVSALKNRGVTPEAFEPRSEDDGALLAAWRRYEEAKCRGGVRAFADFDDLLLLADRLLSDPAAREEEARRYDAVLVDEFQDLNRPQLRIALVLGRAHGNVFAVGDDAQSIYGFRGAEPGVFRAFLAAFPGARVVTLEECYRCTQEILDAASRLPTGSHPKRLRSVRGAGRGVTVFSAPTAELEFGLVAENVAYLLEWCLADEVAVLVRFRSFLRGVSAALAKAGVPHTVVGGPSFLERREVRLALALFALACGCATDEEAALVLRELVAGVGDRALAALREHARREGKTLSDCLWEARAAGLREAQAAALREFAEEAERWRRLPFGREKLDRVLEASGYWEWLARLEEEDLKEGRTLARRESVAALRDMVSSAGSEEEFFSGVALASGADPEERGKVRVMTMHASKGREFTAVFAPALTDALMPGDRDVAEEARVLYVAATRARELLYLSYHSGSPWRQRPSRFLAAMLPGRKEVRAWA